MSYDLHITRREVWSDTFGSEITLQDWLDYLSIDQSLQKDVRFESSRDTGTSTESDELTTVLWSEWPSRGDGDEARLSLLNGNICATDADADLRQKMFVMAHVLGAKLQGEKGETYNSIGEPEKLLKRDKATKDAKRPWWRFR